MQETLERMLDVVDLLATAAIVAGTVLLLRKTRRPMTVSFFLFAMVSLLLTNAYWLAYSLLRPNMRMPLTANTIGECAVFLLLSAALNTVMPGNRFSFSPQIVGTALFAVASVVLWILWSGEWLQNIVGGVVFGAFLCVCVRDLCCADVFNRKEWIALAVCCAGYMAAFFAGVEDEQLPVVYAGYVLMFGTMLFFLGKTIHCIRRKETYEKQIVMSVSSYAFCMSGVYMSSGPWYIAAELLCLLTLPMMLYAFGREAQPA